MPKTFIKLFNSDTKRWELIGLIELGRRYREYIITEVEKGKIIQTEANLEDFINGKR